VRGPKILSSAQEIEQELQALSRHIENVIQTRLMYTYSVIEEYNGTGRRNFRAISFLDLGQLSGRLQRYALARLLDVARNGPRTGTFFLPLSILNRSHHTDLI